MSLACQSSPVRHFLCLAFGRQLENSRSLFTSWSWLALGSLALLVEMSLPGLVGGQEIYNSQVENVPKMSPEEAVGTARLPEGFRMQVVASEPDVQQPIAMAWDLRGRLWVAENYTYAESQKKFDMTLSDRILILEDTDGDGTFDRRKVFYENLKELTSIEVGDGGVWALASPNLVFIPDADYDDIPDGEPQVLVTGFNTEIRHNFANGLRMGPDGWLYGRHGILGSSQVEIVTSPSVANVPPGGYLSRGSSGSPTPNVLVGPAGAFGAPKSNRVALHCGIWRYHPNRGVIEMVCEGTTNPWGMDWDEHGELFFINTVIGHLWHAIPGAHLQRMYGEDSDSIAYELLPQIADHVHWDATGEDWKATRSGSVSSGTDAAGGGHAHSGMMIYQADQWPAEYRNDLFTLNLHGRRINRDRLIRSGAGFLGQHAQDMVHWQDPWFRGIELSTGPDGSVYVIDWSDIGECHDDDGVHRTSGRIYRIVYDAPTPLRLDAMAKLTVAEKSKRVAMLSVSDCKTLLMHPNAWYTRQLIKTLTLHRASLEASKELVDLAMLPSASSAFTAAIDPVVLQLRTLWALNAARQLPDDLLFRLLRTPQHESVHVWAMRLFADRYATLEEADQTEGEAEILGCLTEKPIEQISPLVRLYAAALLPKFQHSGWKIASLLSQSGDLADDRDFPLVLWYGTKAMLEDNPMRAAKLSLHSRIPKLMQLYLRRFASDLLDGPQALSFVVAGVAREDDRNRQSAIIEGLWAAYQGRQSATAPSLWEELAKQTESHPDVAIREKTLLLNGLFRGAIAADALIALATNTDAPVASRRSAIGSLGKIDSDAARTALWNLVSDQFMGGAAAEALGPGLDVDRARQLAARYADVWPPGKSGIVSGLSHRPETLAVLLDAIEQNKIPSSGVDAATWRQFTVVADWDLLNRARAFNPKLGVAEDKEAAIADIQARLTDNRLQRADASRGRTQWNNLCSQCHKLYGEGGAIGPELTGAQRSNQRYWLENILAPSAAVATNYRITAFQMDDDRVITGVLLSENATEITVQTVKEKIILEKSAITARRPSELSLMPEGILDPLDDVAKADLFKYLMSEGQVPAR